MLLIMPFFMAYEKSLVEKLNRNYDVTVINGDSEIRKYRDAFYSTKLHRAVRKLFSFLREIEQEKIIQEDTLIQKKFSIEIDCYDVIFIINGHGVSNRFYLELFEKNQASRKILYLWDDAQNLFKNSHIRLFDERYSYNIDDCKQYGMKYLPMFVQSGYVGHEDINEYDIAIIASAHENRIKTVKKLYKRYKDKYKFFIYFFDPQGTTNFFSYKESMPYNEYISILKKSRVVLDIPNSVQTGPTTRAFDALLTDTKVLTTNSSLSRYPFWSNNTMFFDENIMELNEEFIFSPYNESTYKALEIDDWLNELKLE